jgi:hypothetical protein
MRKNRIFPFFHMLSGPTEGVPHIHAHTPRPGARHCRAIPKLADLCAESRGCAYPQWHICRSSHPRRPSRVNTDQAVPSAMWGHAVAREVQGSARRDAVPLGLLIAPWAVPARIGNTKCFRAVDRLPSHRCRALPSRVRGARMPPGLHGPSGHETEMVQPGRSPAGPHRERCRPGLEGRGRPGRLASPAAGPAPAGQPPSVVRALHARGQRGGSRVAARARARTVGGADARHGEAEHPTLGQAPPQQIASQPRNRRPRLQRLVRRTIGCSTPEQRHDVGIGRFIHR